MLYFKEERESLVVWLEAGDMSGNCRENIKTLQFYGSFLMYTG
jgi:hypothetical protein